MNIRPADIGDEGDVVGWKSHGSVATLLLQVGEGEQVGLLGDWRMVSHLAEALAGERVVVVASEGSHHGAHGIRPLHHVGD